MVPTRNGKVNQSQKASTIPPLDQLKVYSNQDILICGNCREMFSDLHDLLDHKKSYCKLRFTCKCDSNKSKSPDEPSSASLLCVQCKDAFPNAWDLMVHAQAAHMLNIYELGVAAMANCSSPPLSPRDNNTPDKTMSLPNLKNSNPNLSSSSSWIIINESFEERKNSRETIVIESENDTDKNEDFQDIKNSECSLLIEETPEEFVTLEEYVPAKRKTLRSNFKRNKTRQKRKKKQQRKQEVDTLSIISIAACILTITGLTLLTNLLPPSIDEFPINAEQIHNHYIDVLTTTTKASSDAVIKNLTATKDVVNLANDMNLFNVIEKLAANNFSDYEETCAALDTLVNTSDTFNKEPLDVFGPFNFENVNDEDGRDKSILERSFLKGKEFLMNSASTMLRSPTLHVILATVMQDICLIRLIKELSKKKAKKEENETIQVPVNVSEKIVKKTFKKAANKLKPLKNNDNVGKFKFDLKKGIIPSVPKSFCTNVNPAVPSGCCPISSDSTVLNKINTRYYNASTAKTNENGKSECERRFEDLDTEWQTVGQNHRQKIKEIKTKFQQEMVDIKQSEVVSSNRRERMNLTREKYLERLKNDRENYLTEMNKIRQERQNLLGQICHQKYGLGTTSSKDASVGNFAVLLPQSYDFKEKLKNLQQMGADKKLQLGVPVVNNTVCRPPKSPIPYVTKKDKLLNNNTKLKESTKKLEDNTKKYCELKRKYLKKKERLLKKRQIKKGVSDMPAVKDVVNDILSTLSNPSTLTIRALEFSRSPTPNNATKKIEGQDSSQAVIKDLQMVYSAHPKKRNNNEIYEAAFERSGKKIKKLDMIKWSKSEKIPEKMSFVNKQNVSRPVTKEKMIFRGPL